MIATPQFSTFGSGIVGLYTLIALFATGCAGRTSAPDARPAVTSETAVVLPFAAVEWEQLNPARGDQSPAAATLWGNRNGSEPTGFLVRFVDGFSSPPHIHNVSYRGVVIQGLVHNDDPDAAPLWMPPGSYWTQPLGGAHVTSASGGDTIAYIEIEQGPYLVRSVDEATASTEHPVNLHASNLVWLEFATLGWDASSRESGGPPPEVAFLWGDPNADQPRGMLVRLPTDSTAAMRGYDSTFRAVVIDGQALYRRPNGEAPSALQPGSYIHSSRGAVVLTCMAETTCTFYVRAEGRFDVLSE